MILVYIREMDVAEYIGQGWVCIRLAGHHGARKNGKNFLAILVAPNAKQCKVAE